MTKNEDFLVEIHTEELPPKAILKLGHAFCQQIKERLQKADLSFHDAIFYATPRRLAVFVKNLAKRQPDQMLERKGPAVSAAFDAEGNPTPACVGFARSCGVTPAELKTIKTLQGEWVGIVQNVPGKSINELMPAIVEQSALALPIPKRMRWGSGATEFVRPIHSVIMLYGNEVISGKILGFTPGRKTRGHRFHAPNWIDIPHAEKYVPILREAFVMVAIDERRNEIIKLAREAVKQSLSNDAIVQFNDDLLDEVTGLVEWPVAIIGHFDEEFLKVPAEVLISSMQDHQRYFPIVDVDLKLLPHFVTISNIQSLDPYRVAHGNERVLRARLSDAAFFFASDKKESLTERVQRLKGIVFQAKLGTLYDKAERLSKLAATIARSMHADADLAAAAGMFAKADLTTNMVGEFPELQGIMGYYYALNEGLPKAVATALQEHYLPRFAGDVLPKNPVSQALAIADRLDTLVGAFGINQIPTGDKDPYGLRRAALGIIRILIENQIHLDLGDMLRAATANYVVRLDNPEIIPQVSIFIQERLRSWYQEQGVTPDVFASVASLGILDPLNIHARIQAVQAFKALAEAEALSVANKRVSNILAKYTDSIDATEIDPNYFEHSVEHDLARELDAKSRVVMQLSQDGKYDEVLKQLAELRQPVDDFFDKVMVMTEDKPRRENRILLLSKLRALFLQVADIALLQ